MFENSMSVFSDRVKAFFEHVHLEERMSFRPGNWPWTASGELKGALSVIYGAKPRASSTTQHRKHQRQHLAHGLKQRN
jgi:hypothetical protein